jgi:hypothetical protein
LGFPLSGSQESGRLRTLKNRHAEVSHNVAMAGFYVSTGLIGAGLRVGQDLDLVSKQCSYLLDLFRPDTNHI